MQQPESAKEDQCQNHQRLHFFAVRFRSDDGEPKTLLTQEIAFEPLSASFLVRRVGVNAAYDEDEIVNQLPNFSEYRFHAEWIKCLSLEPASVLQMCRLDVYFFGSRMLSVPSSSRVINSRWGDVFILSMNSFGVLHHDGL